ncbi:hypothetical protein D9623_03200 [Azospirillum brasilense]|uniref:Uncharacterized protein n=1 Tax=Azospirillum brasilense TaxID=192 RepID=A0A4D8QDS3_AZOBR|nr:hypothetical protein FE89_21610 [Azospirillum brasilense]PWC93791.1 hypothetical protein AEJ54_11430 [Azospirillum sp. Sp 7]OPH20931.1 hypothetical protein FE88_11350 [Azospirillum brasilense]QCO08795.1 hypothetical protein D3868_06895 [Azospirillum brasilense]QEL89221.1 hypothetical protein D9621_03195 [Azospirillum brasilense]
MAFATIAGADGVLRRAWCSAKRGAFHTPGHRRSATPDGDALWGASDGLPMTGDHFRSGTPLA